MTRWIAGFLVAFTFAGAHSAFAQEGPATAGRAEITIIPGGATWFTESKDAAAPKFGNYQFGGSVTYNANRILGVEGEVGSSVGISQSLNFGYTNAVRTPDTVTYSGNLVMSIPTGSSVVPYATGGAGGLSVFSRKEFGIAKTETLFTSNVGGGVKWYAGRWGLRGDYRFIAIPSKSDTPAFLGVGNKARYGHRVYGAVLLNVGR